MRGAGAPFLFGAGAALILIGQEMEEKGFAGAAIIGEVMGGLVGADGVFGLRAAFAVSRAGIKTEADELFLDLGDEGVVFSAVIFIVAMFIAAIFILERDGGEE